MLKKWSPSFVDRLRLRKKTFHPLVCSGSVVKTDGTYYVDLTAFRGLFYLNLVGWVQLLYVDFYDNQEAWFRGKQVLDIGCNIGDIFKVHSFSLGTHRRRIYTEDKGKVVAAVWGTEFIPFLAMLAVFHQDDMKKRMNILFFNSSRKL